MAVYDGSRYLHTPMYNRFEGTTPVLKMRRRFSFNEQRCTYYTWIDGDTLDGVAFKHFGDCALRWAILDANPEYRTEFEIEAGDVILLPDPDEVVDLVNV